MMALKVTLPPGNPTRGQSRPGHGQIVRSSKPNSRRSSLSVEQAVQDNLTEIAAATAELENAKPALIPSAPTTDPGSACITFSREQSAELQGFLLSCQKSMATDPEEKERAKRRCNESHEAAGVIQEAAQEEVDTAHKLAKLIGWVGEKLAAPNPPPPAPATAHTASPNRQQHRCHHERRHPPRNRPAHGTGTTGGSIQPGVSTGFHRAPRGLCHSHMNDCQGSKGSWLSAMDRRGSW